jgi:hypothetical protein
VIPLPDGTRFVLFQFLFIDGSTSQVYRAKDD